MRTIIVEPYSETWPMEFQKICRELTAALGSAALSVEHVGSTAVPGLPAKPIIDIDVIIEGYDVFPEVVRRLAAIGYTHVGDKGIPTREAFDYASKPGLMPHHLYVCPESSPELRRHLALRDYLRAHPEAAAEYGRVKQEGASLYPHDIDAYIAHKSACILNIYRRAGLDV